VKKRCETIRFPRMSSDSPSLDDKRWKKVRDHKVPPHVIELAVSGWQKVKKGVGPYGSPACHRTHSLWMTKGAKRCETIWFPRMSSDSLSLDDKCTDDHNLSLRAIRRWVLQIAERMFIRITTWVFPHVTWLQGQYDRDCGAADKSEALTPTYPQFVMRNSDLRSSW